MTKPQSELHADFLRLRQELKCDGLFSVSPVRIAADLGFISALFVASYVLYLAQPILAFALSTVASIHLVWWIHDCGHDAIVQNRNLSKALIEGFGVVFLGMPQMEYHYGIHRRHHGFTNIFGKDTALETGPVIWHPLMRERSPACFRPFQLLAWIGLVLPLTYPLITFRCLQLSLEKGHWGRIAFWAARWALFVGVIGISPVLLIGPVLIAGFVLGFAASLNHFSMPIAPSFDFPYPGPVFYTTQNLSCPSRFATWLTGGLNFHIEHHLFPSMPSGNYRHASPKVRAFAKRHGLPYHSQGAIACAKELVSTLRNPLHLSPKRKGAV